MGVADWQLEIPPVWANSSRTVDAAASAIVGRGQPHVALDGAALTVRNSHQIRRHLPRSVTGQSRSRLSGAAPCEGMCWEQSRQKRTIATSRSDDNRDESRTSDNDRNAGFIATNKPEKDEDVRPALSVRSHPEENRFPLDKLFQERSDTPTLVALADVTTANRRGN